MFPPAKGWVQEAFLGHRLKGKVELTLAGSLRRTL